VSKAQKKQLRCVQAAKGDIDKLQRCVPSA
jgi:hypothetical protein